MRTGKEAIIIPSANDENTRRKSPRSRKWLAQRSLRDSGGAERGGRKKVYLRTSRENVFPNYERTWDVHTGYQGRKPINSIKYRTLTQSSCRELAFPYSQKEYSLSLFISPPSLSLSQERESISSIVFRHRGISIMLRRLLNSNEISRTRILGIFSNFNSIGNNRHVTNFRLIVEKKRKRTIWKKYRKTNEIPNGKELYRAITLSFFSIHRLPNSMFGIKRTISFSLSYKRTVPQRNYSVKHWNNTSPWSSRSLLFVPTYLPRKGNILRDFWPVYEAPLSSFRPVTGHRFRSCFDQRRSPYGNRRTTLEWLNNMKSPISYCTKIFLDSSPFVNEFRNLIQFLFRFMLIFYLE